MHTQRGLLMLELAIGIVILSLLTGFALTGIQAQRTNAGLKETQQKLDTLKEALVTFISRNNRLPCPAVAGAAPGAANYGAEAPPSPPANTCTGTIAAGSASYGVVPWIALGLPDDMALDGFNQRFSYVVDNAATNLNNTSVTGLRGSIAVHNATPTAPANQINNCPLVLGVNPCLAVVAIISHGPNTSGAFLPSGGQLPLPAGGNEQENTNADAVLTQMLFVGNPGAAGGIFDDNVAWLTAGELLSPLIADRSLNTVPGALNQAFSTLADAVIGATMASQTGAPGAYSYTLPGAVPPGVALTDPWGVNMVYNPDLTVNPITATTPSPAPPGNAFTLVSSGPDGIAATGDEPPPYAIPFVQLQGILARTGF